jgi:hypothetical protein
LIFLLKKAAFSLSNFSYDCAGWEKRSELGRMQLLACISHPMRAKTYKTANNKDFKEFM